MGANKFQVFLELERDRTDQNLISKSSKSRLYLVLFFIALAYLFLIIKIVKISLFTDQIEKNHFVETIVQRGNIYDRRGKVIATNLPIKSLYAVPEQIINPKEVSEVISKVLQSFCKDCPHFAANRILSKLLQGKNFVWLKRHLLPEEFVQIQHLGIPGLYFLDDQKRFYPQENLLSHLIGLVDIDQKGIAGLEKNFDALLKTGKNLTLSLDSSVQEIVRFQLQTAIKEEEALGGMVLIMEANSGRIIASVSLPDFNPNLMKKIDPISIFNRASLGIYEMGSTFKILTLATAFDLGVVKESDTFNVTQPLKLGKYKVNDYKFHKALLTLPEVLIFSSNRGIGQIAQKIGKTHQKDYLKKLGLLEPIKLEISEVGKPVLPRYWNDTNLVTISYGYGIAVTALHTVTAIGAAVNGGILYQPTLLQAKSKQGIRVFQEKTSQVMKKILRLVVEEGYASKAEVPGYRVGGKTGTAEKIKGGIYMKKNCNLAFFAGAFPIDKPDFIIFVAVDEPKPNKKNLGFTTGGMIAAPLAAKIIQEAGHLLYLDKNFEALTNLELSQ
jgi:cell division protein FtsI (penicillin-binding protein 3)